MVIALKSDAQSIIKHLDNLKKQSWLTKSQSWWPDYVYHFTDITNVVNILRGNALLSRVELKKAGEHFVDGASSEVILYTSDQWKKYVRLYFRPRTPTQYSNEGFRPLQRRNLSAHCPVPVVLLFDSRNILTRQTTKFSNGNLAAGAAVGDDASFLTSIPFEKVYHDSYFNPLEKAEIIFHRHAEVIIPDALDLSCLKLIHCRSQAEFETLINLLPHRIYLKWHNKIGVDSKFKLFYGKWAFITKTDLSMTDISFTFNPILNNLNAGPFKALLEVLEHKTDTVYSWKDDDFYTNAKNPLSFSLSKMQYPEHYTVSFRLDDDLAYKNTFFDESETPF